MEALLETKEIEKGVTDITTKALALKVVNISTYQMAGQILLLHKDMGKKIKEYFKPLKSKTYDAWKSICYAETDELEKLRPGINYLSGEMSKYNTEQEKIRRAEELRLRQSALIREEEERLQMAIKAEKEGDKEEAEAILTEPVYVPTPIVLKTVPKINGLAPITTWTFRVVDEKKVPREYLMIDEIKIGRIVRALRGKTNIPGIEVYKETSMKGVRK